MQEEGIVTEYNGFIGRIRNMEGKEYLLLKKDVENGKMVNINDKVVFTPDLFETDEYRENVARFIRKLEK